MEKIKKLNCKNISIILCYLTISSYIILGNCMTFNIGNRMPIKVAEIIALISCLILVIIHKKDVIKLSKDNIKIILWFVIATIPMFIYGYEIKHILYGLLYSIRVIATLAVAIVITNTLKKYEVSRDKIFNYFINNYLIVCFIGIFQLIFFPFAYDFYNIFYKMGVYFANPDPHVDRLISTYFDPNFLAACLIIPTVITLDYFARTNKKKYLIEFTCFVVTIILTVSRSGVAGLCLALFIYALCTVKFENKKIQKSKFTIRAFGVMIAVAIIFIFLTLFTNIRVFKRILGTASDESTFARFEDWSKAANMIGGNEDDENNKNNDYVKNSEINPLFGIGYNMIGFTEANSTKAESAAFGNDSSLILIYISSGIIGTVYFAVIIISKLVKDYKDRYKYINNISVITILITSLAICNFNNLLFYILWLFPIFILLNMDKEEIDNIENKRDNIKKEKLRIGIDARGLWSNKAGIGTYIESIIKELNEKDNVNEYILYSTREIVLNFKLKENFTVKEKIKGPRSFWFYFSLPKVLKQDNIDVYWGTQHLLPKRNEFTSDIKYVLTIHDLAIQKIKNIGYLRNFLIQKLFVKKSLQIADKIIAISEATKNDIIELYKIPEEKIRVIYERNKF